MAAPTEQPAEPRPCNGRPECPNDATHRYGHWEVCADCYIDLATIDERPHQIPANYDWDRELAQHQLP